VPTRTTTETRHGVEGPNTAGSEGWLEGGRRRRIGFPDFKRLPCEFSLTGGVCISSHPFLIPVGSSQSGQQKSESEQRDFGGALLFP
jgi:hypothetical protein